MTGTTGGTQAKVGRWAIAAAVALCVAQAASFYALFNALEAKVFPENSALFGALIYIVTVIPVVALAGFTAIRPRAALIWTCFAAILVGGAGAWHAFASDTTDGALAFNPFAFTSALALGVTALGVGQGLVAALMNTEFVGDRYPRFAASIAKLLLQGLLAFLIQILFAIISSLFRLTLGDFDISQGTYFGERNAYWTCLFTIAFAISVLAIETRRTMFDQIGALLAGLGSWFLPLFALIAAASVAALAYSAVSHTPGSGPRDMALVFLTIIALNAAYRAGRPETRPNGLLRWAARVAGVLVAPLIIFAGVDLWRSTAHHGLTVEIVSSLALCVVLGSAACGYLIAGLWPGPWMKPMQATNFLAAALTIVVALGLNSPLADPARLSADDYAWRISKGSDPSNLIYGWSEYGRFGHQALEAVAKDYRTSASREAARKARLALFQMPDSRSRLDLEDLRPDIRVHPAGARLPDSFLRLAADTGEGPFPIQCARVGCDAVLIDLDGDGSPEILLSGPDGTSVFKLLPKGTWTQIGTVQLGECDSDAIRNGKIEAVAPAWRDLSVDGRRRTIARSGGPECPDDTPNEGRTIREVIVKYSPRL